MLYKPGMRSCGFQVQTHSTQKFLLTPLTPAETQRTLDALGHKPNRRLGQNFLIDGNIVQKSIDLAQVDKQDTIIEIGPGLGTLTRALLATGATVYAVEYDQRLFNHLKTTLTPRYPDTFNIIHADAVEHPRAGFQPTDKSNKAIKIVANLPYNISTPWLEKILQGPLPSCLVLMLQKEAADRFTATCGSKNFSAISILIEGTYERVKGHRVSNRCFYPLPQVGSVLLNLKRKEQPFIFSTETRQIMRDFFTQRRKQIGHLARNHKAQETLIPWLSKLEALGHSLNTRPEALPYAAWVELEK